MERKDKMTAEELVSKILGAYYGRTAPAIPKEQSLKYIEEYTAPLTAEAERYRKALEFVVNRENLMFAECSDAEEILGVCKFALQRQPEEGGECR